MGAYCICSSTRNCLRCSVRRTWLLESRQDPGRVPGRWLTWRVSRADVPARSPSLQRCAASSLLWVAQKLSATDSSSEALVLWQQVQRAVAFLIFCCHVGLAGGQESKQRGFSLLGSCMQGGVSVAACVGIGSGAEEIGGR